MSAQRLFRSFTVRVAALSVFLPWFCGCAATGRQFLENHTGVAISKDISVCNTGTWSSDQCEPQGGGGRFRWQRTDNFPYMEVSPNPMSDPNEAIEQVRRYYLGTPYYGEDLHASCKASIDSSAIPGEQQLKQDFDLAAELNRTAVSSVTARLGAKLSAKHVDASAQLAAVFNYTLKEVVSQKIRARFVWFVARYPGGKPDILNNPQLTACVNALNGAPAPASLVTGVAGYIILGNVTHADLSSSETVNIALGASIRGRVSPDVYEDVLGDLSAAWKDSVEKVAVIKLDRRDLNTVAYPLWVQFE